jgi:hypothetical protein
MLATLVATDGYWGAYVATQEMLEKKEQPHFLAGMYMIDSAGHHDASELEVLQHGTVHMSPASSVLPPVPFERPSEVTAEINKRYPEQFTGYTDYGSFWQQIAYAGIEKPATMPHREPYTKEDWQRGRVRNCFECKKVAEVNR